MARRRSHKGRHRHYNRRRRVGAMALNPQQPVIKLAAVALGYFLAADINVQLDKIIPASVATATDATKYIPAAAETGLGALLLLSKKKPSLIKTIAGGLLAGAGVNRLLKATGTITGYQSVPVIGRAARHRMAGYQSVPVVGVTTPPQLAGKLPAQLEGYRVNGYQPHGSGVMGSIDTRNADRGSGISYGSSSGYMG